MFIDQKIWGLIAVLTAFFLFGFLLTVFVSYFNDPFEYPKIVQHIDISGQRKPDYMECVENWIINNRNKSIRVMYEEKLSEWRNVSEAVLARQKLWKKRKRRIYDEMKSEVESSDYALFIFIFERTHRRYRQVNYQKIPYDAVDTEIEMTFSVKELAAVYDELEKIGFETTRQKFFAADQRKLVTKELHQKIKVRDNYTCRICGKYMPDEVGLQIDHIIPIKKGGKSVESNLQVLCDKCNRRKGAK